MKTVHLNKYWTSTKFKVMMIVQVYRQKIEKPIGAEREQFLVVDRINRNHPVDLGGDQICILDLGFSYQKHHLIKTERNLFCICINTIFYVSVENAAPANPNSDFLHALKLMP